MPDLPVGESDPLAPLLPYLKHDPLCGIVGAYEYGCNCGRDAALAEVRVSVPTLSDEDRVEVDRARGLLPIERHSSRYPVIRSLVRIIDARFPDLGDQ